MRFAPAFLFALRTDRFVELAPCMRPTTNMRQPAHHDHGVVAVIAIRLQIPFEPLEQTLGYRLTATRVIVIQHDALGRRPAALYPQVRFGLRRFLRLFAY